MTALKAGWTVIFLYLLNKLVSGDYLGFKPGKNFIGVEYMFREEFDRQAGTAKTKIEMLSKIRSDILRWQCLRAFISALASFWHLRSGDCSAALHGRKLLWDWLLVLH